MTFKSRYLAFTISKTFGLRQTSTSAHRYDLHHRRRLLVQKQSTGKRLHEVISLCRVAAHLTCTQLEYSFIDHLEIKSQPISLSSSRKPAQPCDIHRFKTVIEFIIKMWAISIRLYHFSAECAVYYLDQFCFFVKKSVQINWRNSSKA